MTRERKRGICCSARGRGGGGDVGVDARPTHAVSCLPTASHPSALTGVASMTISTHVARGSCGAHGVWLLIRSSISPSHHVCVVVRAFCRLSSRLPPFRPLSISVAPAVCLSRGSRRRRPRLPPIRIGEVSVLHATTSSIIPLVASSPAFALYKGFSSSVCLSGVIWGAPFLFAEVGIVESISPSISMRSGLLG